MRNLLITTVGSYNLLHVWTAGNANFDVVTVDYTQTPTFKYPGIYKAVLDLPRTYDYYWMPDEDIYLSTRSINRMFEQMARFGLDLGQPSVEDSKRSFPSWPMFVHKPGPVFKPMPFVEVMCPCFSLRGLMTCLDTFPKSNGGWGLDIAWAKLLDYQHMGLMNNIVVRHTRPPIQGSNLYKILKDSPSKEMHRLIEEYEVIMIPYNADKAKKGGRDGDAPAKRRVSKGRSRVHIRPNGRDILDSKPVREGSRVDRKAQKGFCDPRRQLFGRRG
jgi:hypothetical protein